MVNSKCRTEDMYGMVTDRLIAEIEKGGLRWVKGWTQTGLPMNGATKTSYRGINMLWLMMEIRDKGYKSNRFYTYRQVKGLKGHVIAGSKGLPIFFYKPIEISVENKETGKQEIKRIPMLRSFIVFNQDQTSLKGMDADAVREPVEIIKICEDIAGWSDSPRMMTDSSAYYMSRWDIIGIPDMQSFRTAEMYYATLFHEMIHSTGSKGRLNRDGIVKTNAFGSDMYSREEIIAELGASILCAKAGIFEDNVSNSSAYIDSWLRSLKKDKRFIFKVMSQVQASVDLITGTGS
ncbi:DUF1738 domain-containing protein [archaeon]|nr:DUF1738 domain-containing protein [archaeon]